MAKTKKHNGKPAKVAKRPDPDKPRPSVVPRVLSRDVPEIRRQVVKIDRHKREILHEIWPEFLLHQVSTAESAIWRSFGTYGDGLTPQEKEALKEIRQNLKLELDKLNIIYFRLKFWS